jgi:uncharacterized membrane protein YfcA
VTPVDRAEPWLPLVAVGLTAGLLAGLLGVGGGIVMIPMMLAFLHFDQHAAHATSLAAIIIIATAGAAVFAASGEVDLAVGVTMGLFGVAGSTLGAQVMHRLSVADLKLVFAVIVVAAGVRMLFDVGDATAEPLAEVARFAVAALIGLLAGFGAGVAGIGGGIVMVPARVFLLGMTQHTAEGTSLVAIVLTALAGTRVNLRNRRVHLRPALVMGAAGAAVAPLSAWVAVRIDAPVLARIFGVFVVVAGLQMLVSAVRYRRRPEV